MAKPKFGMYSAAACGGCEIAVANLHEKLLEIDMAFDLVFCPCLVDTKKRDVEAWGDGDIDITFFNGSIRTDENEEMAYLLRRKSRLIVAFGACAQLGGIPGLSNLSCAADHLRTIFLQGPTLDNPDGVIPQKRTEIDGEVLSLPTFHDGVRPLNDVINVDYVIPGCPPEPHQIWTVVDAAIQDALWQNTGAVVGAGVSSVCVECPRTRGDKKVERWRRIWEFIPDTDRCLLEQGLVCMGIATRNGCGALCPRVNQPCTGCYGPPEGIRDQGGSMVSVLGSMIDIEPLKGLSEEEVMAHIDAILGGLEDDIGCFYMFGMPGSLLKTAIAARLGVPSQIRE